jgi:hypothetical protein
MFNYITNVDGELGDCENWQCTEGLFSPDKKNAEYKAPISKLNRKQHDSVTHTVQGIGIPVYHFITGGAEVGKSVNSGLLDPALVV